ncbi:MAG: CopG family transcriptional regulator [Candidatus Aureabacteria bacterium]|nr:CopG family transcriptional regulator [Candidatus Auribacterota bacterium]
MTVLSKRATIYLNADLFRVIRIKSAETSKSVSEIVNDAVRLSLAEDAEDLAAFDERAHEPVITFEKALKELRRHGKI